MISVRFALKVSSTRSPIGLSLGQAEDTSDYFPRQFLEDGQGSFRRSTKAPRRIDLSVCPLVNVAFWRYRSVRDIKITLLYPPHQAWPGHMCRPNGSLAYPSLAGGLHEAGFEVNIFDACVGNAKDDLDKMFYVSKTLPTGLLRTGVDDERILQEVKDADIVGLTSILSDQESMVLATSRLIKKHFPEKLIVTRRGSMPAID